MVCREMPQESCLTPICGMFDFLCFPAHSSHSPKIKVTPVGVGRGEKFQARLKQS